jgi:hypothetical protein
VPYECSLVNVRWKFEAGCLPAAGEYLVLQSDVEPIALSVSCRAKLYADENGVIMMGTSVKDHYLPIWLKHVKFLAEDIGPRGSTTQKEREAAEYCHQVFSDLHITPQMETFRSAKSFYQPHLLASSFLILAVVLYPLAGRISAIIAALISLSAYASQMLELSFRDNIFRRLVPKGDSQNAFAVMPPKGEHKGDLVLIGHVDSHRTPLVFSSPTWLKVFQALMTIVFLLASTQVVLYIIGIFTLWSWIWPVTILTAIGELIFAAVYIQADRTPFSAGANDNATSAGLLLTLAQHFQNEPLQNTRVWLVCTGCEEVQHYGAIDFFRRHTSELRNPVAVAFEMLGCAGPSWITKEGVIIPFHSDRKLVQLAEQVAEAHPYLGAHSGQIGGANTEMADALRAGIPAIALNGMGQKGEPLYWHTVEDTYDKMDPEVMERAYEFVWEYIQAIDSMHSQTVAV